MRDYRLRADLERVVIDGFAMPLGLDPGDLAPPTQGYTVTYNVAEDDEPDTYTFHVVVSHERVSEVLQRAFRLLPDEVYAIIEVGSRDAYRSVDSYISAEPVDRDVFLRQWRAWEPFLLEDASVGAGANAEEPFVEVFLDQWKGVAVHVPVDMRDRVEDLLRGMGLDEVQATWPIEDDDPPGTSVRPVLLVEDEYSPDVDEILLEMRQQWQLELNVDPDRNLDEAGRELGVTLWHAVVIAQPRNGGPDEGAYISVWATAASLAQATDIVERAVADLPDWMFAEVYTIDRIAYDERPDELASLPPRPREAQVHYIAIDAWSPEDEPPAGDEGNVAAS